MPREDGSLSQSIRGSNDSLGDRMKGYEAASRYVLPPSTRRPMSNQKKSDHDNFAFWLWLHYRLEPSDVVPTETPGYWRKVKPCEPKYCGSPLHGFLFNEGPCFHTVSYTTPEWESRDEHGRFVSPYRYWRQCREGLRHAV